MALAGGKEFNLNLEGWAKKAKGQMDALARQSVQAISERVIDTTPVDTGFLRGSWQPSIGAPANGKAEEGASDGVSAGKVTLVANSLKPGDVYFMVNNAAYAKRIEWGFVGQDSLGRTYNQRGRFFVTDAMTMWKQIVADVAKDLGITK